MDTANDRQQACEFDEISGIDVIFMDVHMPVKYGIEATRELRAAGFEGPIIGVSAREANREPALEVGMSHFYAAKIPALVVKDAGFIEQVLCLCGDPDE